MPRFSKAIALLLSSILILITISGCSKPQNSGPGPSYTDIAYIKYEDDGWIYRETYSEDLEEQIVQIYENGTLTIEKSYTGNDIKRFGYHLKLPVVTEKLDIDSFGLITDDTYQLTLAESAAYINTLADEGYTIVFEAATSEFIELYMSKDSESYKRIIITNNYLVTYDTDEIIFNINDYIVEIKEEA